MEIVVDVTQHCLNLGRILYVFSWIELMNIETVKQKNKNKKNQ